MRSRLFNKGTGVDTISDFITNLIIDWLALYTEKIAEECSIEQRQSFPITYFDDQGEIKIRSFNLPYIEFKDNRMVLKREYIILTPKDIVARDLMHISIENFNKKFEEIPSIMSEYFPQVQENITLREHLNEYISQTLKEKKKISDKDIENYKESYKDKYEQLISVFVNVQESCKQEAFENNLESINATETIYTKIVSNIFTEMGKYRGFLEKKSDSFTTALHKAVILKKVVETHSNYVFYRGILSEPDLHRVFKYCISECDFPIESTGSEIRNDLLLRIDYSESDSTNIEIRVASNISSKEDIRIYDKASLQINGLLVVFFHTDDQYYRMMRLFNSCGLTLEEYKRIVLIDARLTKNNLTFLPCILRKENAIPRKVFISYTHKPKDKDAGIFADERLSSILECDGTLVTRDEKNNEYKTDLIEFMKTIKSHDFVVAIISDFYLKSQPCMFEATQLMKNKNYRDKLLPIIGSEISIFKAKGRADIVRFWQKEERSLKKEISKIESEDRKVELKKDLEEISLIADKVGELVKYLSTVLSFNINKMQEEDFESIINLIRKSKKKVAAND